MHHIPIFCHFNLGNTVFAFKLPYENKTSSNYHLTTLQPYKTTVDCTDCARVGVPVSKKVLKAVSMLP